MVDKAQTGMQGVFLVAAELSGLGFIVSPTSRGAFGADLLVTDQHCKRAWSVQVKTNRLPASFWLMNKHTKDLTSEIHVYVFVNMNGKKPPSYYVVKSAFVAEKVYEQETKSGTWYSFDRSDAKPHLDAWNEVFGVTVPVAAKPSESLGEDTPAVSEPGAL